MALITSAASGNFSAGATWTGGVVPGVGDEARASTGHTITIDVNTTCDLVSNAGTGKFVLADGVTLTANITSLTTNVNVNCAELAATNNASIVGNILSRTNGNVTYAVANLGTGTLTITGNAEGSNLPTTNNRHTILNNSSGVINITGNINGGIGTAANHVIFNSSTGTVTVTGSVTATGQNLSPIVNNSTGTISVVGNMIAGTSPAITSTNASSTVKVSGDFIYSATGVVPVYAQKLILDTTPSVAKTRYALNGTGTYVDMFTADNALTQADPADVRSGTVYADGNLTGTCAVPAAASVAFGVPVDATTGTAALEPSDIAAAVWDRVLTGATHNIPSSAGRRLRILDDERIITDGQVQGAGTNTVTLEPITTLCIGQTVVVTDQTTGNKQVRFILAFDSATNVATVDTQWCDIPTVGDEYQLTTVRSPLIARNDYPSGTIGAEIDEMYLIQGLKDGETLTVTPTSRTAGAIAQTIGGDGTTTTTVSRD
jgi:hypothetical protein